MKLFDSVEFTEVEARRMAVDILEEEANQLAVVSNKIDSGEFQRTHREHIAIQREMKRLRKIAEFLKGEGAKK